eukprot:scaffold19881_cov23-Tisochrysis_lutea.AAC.2
MTCRLLLLALNHPHRVFGANTRADPWATMIILGAVEEVELHPRAGKGPRLVPMVLKAFDSQDWHPITNLLKRIIAGHGFGRQGLHAGTAVAKKMAGLIRPGSRQGSGPYPSPVLQ